MGIDAQRLADEIADIHGALVAHDVFIRAASRVIGWAALPQLQEAFSEEMEAARAHLLHSKASERMLTSADERCELIAKSLRALQDS